MTSKRRESGGAAPPGTGKRSRAADEPPPPSPGKRLWAAARTVLVVLFLIRRNDGVDSLARIGRVLRAIWTKMERMEARIQDLAHKVDRISPTITISRGPGKGFSCHHIGKQGANQEGDSAEAKGLAAAEGEGENTSIRLRFISDGMKSPIYHDDEIKSQSDAAIKIGIFDGDKMIKSGPLSKVKIEVLALEGSFPYCANDSWTANEFNEHRAGGREGKGDVLVGEGTSARLINGECVLGTIRFREGSCRARKGMFLVAARVCDCQATGGRVQEAVMNPVIVQDRRNKTNEKSHPPKLNDKVHRLEEIAKDGRYFKRLEEKKIYTVEDFLKALNKNPDNLAEILKINKEHKPWKRMIAHARECCLKGKHKLKSYTCAEKNVKLFFNCVHYLVGAAFFGGHYTPSDKFDPAQQALVDELKKGAYAELDVLPEDHVMIENCHGPIHVDTYADVGAGPSYTSTATQQNFYGRISANQVGVTTAVEGLSQAQTPSCANVNYGPGTSSYLSDRPSIHNYDAGCVAAGQGFNHGPIESPCSIANNGPGPSSYISKQLSIHNDDARGVPAGQGFNHGPIESPCSIANNGPGPSFSTPDHPSTHNYHDELSRIPGQEQFPSAFPNVLCQGSYGPLNPSNRTTALGGHEQDEYGHLPQPATINCVAPGLELDQNLFLLLCNDLQASTSAHSVVTLAPQQPRTYGNRCSWISSRERAEPNASSLAQ
ncbi:hypothetical protein EJB05_01174, partial [Eragrostis curvula]